MHHSFFFLLFFPPTKSCSWLSHQQTKWWLSGHDMGSPGPQHWWDTAQSSSQIHPVPLKTGRYHHSSAPGGTNTCKAWLCWRNIKGRRHLLGRQHSNHLGLWRQEVKNNISSELSASPVFPSSPPSGSELQELRSFDVNLSDTLVSSLPWPILAHTHLCEILIIGMSTLVRKPFLNYTLN